MTLEEHKEFPVDSASLKEIRNFAREVLTKDEMFSSTKDDVVLAQIESDNYFTFLYNFITAFLHPRISSRA